jgi:hypothetical protein
MDIGKLRFSSLLIFPGFGYPGAAFLFLKFPRECTEVMRTLNRVALTIVISDIPPAGSVHFEEFK